MSEKKMRLDPVTGLMVPDVQMEPLFLIVDTSTAVAGLLTGTAYGFGYTRAEAMRKQLQMGLRGKTEIIEG